MEHSSRVWVESSMHTSPEAEPGPPWGLGFVLLYVFVYGFPFYSKSRAI